MLFDKSYEVFWEDSGTYMNTCLRKWYHFLYIKLPWQLEKKRVRHMSTYYDFNELMSKAKNEYREKKAFVKYWSKIERKFRRMQMTFSPMFVMSFKHDIHGDLIYDDEFRIRAIADYYGYNITGEDLKANASVYTFEKKS